ncbi:MAG: DUF192 domain-containing protein [Acidimicrobiia bacterium]|nr:DUF192 domain-containing protein [Acidimicrobiia bacterium]
MVKLLGVGVLCLLVSCGSPSGTLDDLNLRTVTLPDGTKIKSEVMIRPEDMARGMMFRDSLAPDRGMLFIHPEPAKNPYWMFQCKIALDIMWLDASKRLVEMSPDTPPCPGPPETCPNYGGNQVSSYVLEMAAGSIARHKLKLGDRIDF